MKNKLTVVLATFNEEKNITNCLQSVKEIADEIIVYDENSTDKTVKLAEELGAKVYKFTHTTNFHQTKQKAIDKATCNWILQLDADEVVTPELSREIDSVIKGKHTKFLKSIENKDFFRKTKLFERHTKLIEKRENINFDKEGEIVAYFLPRKNMFLGKPLIHGGVYPDGVIRLFKKGYAKLPAQSVHELMSVKGRVGWIYSDLIHNESPTFSRYLKRANLYTDLTAEKMHKERFGRSIIQLFFYSFIKPTEVFINIFFLKKGFLDGFNGLVWALFSSLHFPIAYFKYWQATHK